MREPAWMTRYSAREAIKNGRPEEAHRLLDSMAATGDKKVYALKADVVRGYVDRAERALRNDDVEGAWRDLNHVAPIAPTGDPIVVKLRDTLVRLAIAEIRAMLEAGRPLQAIEAVNHLKERPGDSPALPSLEQAALAWQEAINFADKGDFPAARANLERVRPTLGTRTSGLDRFEENLNLREDRFRIAWPLLQEATAAGNWREMLRTADDVIAAAPRHREGQQARNRAWQVVQPEAVKPTPNLMETVAHTPSTDIVPALMPKRFFLWIDGIGAYLVCTGTRVSIGQATGDGPVDVPLFADVSRIHASLTRDSENYLLEAGKAVTLNDRFADSAVLQSGDTLNLGNTCQLCFDLPVPGSLSARLRLSRGRRLPMAVDGVLLMNDMLVMGTSEASHVVIPELDKPFYLLRQKDQLIVKWDGDFRIEGQKHEQKAVLPRQGSISSDVFTFAIEPVK
jgi:hypothetical protein